MKKLRTLFILILSHVFAANVLQAQYKELPDFSKAKSVSHKELKEMTTLLWSGTSLSVNNACEVGDYKATLYFQKGDIIYKVLDFNVRCLNRGELSAVLTPQNILRLSSSVDAIGTGHWWIVANVGNCGNVFEYNVLEYNVIRNEYKINCK